MTQAVDAFADLSYSSAIVFEGEAGTGKTKMLESACECVHRHKIALRPRNGTYEAMSGNAALSFVSAVLEEQWNLTGNLSIDSKTALVREEVQKLASPFAMSYIGLLECVIPGLALNAEDLEESLPPGSVYAILLRMVSAFIISDVKHGKKAFVADNAHLLSVQTWSVLRNLFISLERNFMLILGQRSASRDENAKKISQWLANSPRSLCLHLRELSKADTASLACAVLEVTKIPRPLATAIFEKCRGHPRFIMEVSELLLAEEKVVVEGGTCRVDKDDWDNLKLPNTMRAVMVSRLDQLSSSQQITLKVASVIGPVFSLTLVCDGMFRAKREVTLISRWMKLTRLCSHAPVAALLPAHVGQYIRQAQTNSR